MSETQSHAADAADGGGRYRTEDHHGLRPPDNNICENYPLKSRGFWCQSCGAKCTIGLTGDEYGHFGDCPHDSCSRHKAEKESCKLRKERAKRNPDSRTCNYCGVTFPPEPGSASQHCSSSCASKTGHETREEKE